jgi:hypothetical protein
MHFLPGIQRTGYGNLVQVGTARNKNLFESAPVMKGTGISETLLTFERKQKAMDRFT